MSLLIWRNWRSRFWDFLKNVSSVRRFCISNQFLWTPTFEVGLWRGRQTQPREYTGSAYRTPFVLTRQTNTCTGNRILILVLLLREIALKECLFQARCQPPFGLSNKLYQNGSLSIDHRWLIDDPLAKFIRWADDAGDLLLRSSRGFSILETSAMTIVEFRSAWFQAALKSWPPAIPLQCGLRPTQ